METTEQSLTKYIKGNFDLNFNTITESMPLLGENYYGRGTPDNSSASLAETELTYFGVTRTF